MPYGVDDDFVPISVNDFVASDVDDFAPIDDFEEITKPMSRTEIALGKAEEIGKAPGLVDRLSASLKRKLSIFQKAGLEGLTLNNVTLNELPLWSQADKTTFTKRASEVVPNTTVEKLQYDITKFGYSLVPMYIAGKLIGWGKVGLTKPQIVARTGAVGGILGALEKPKGEETRVGGAVRGAVSFAGFTAAGLGLQHILSRYSQAHLKSTLDRAMKSVAEIEPLIQNMDTNKAYEALQSLSPYERNTVLNILRGKWGMPQEQWKNWFEKNIGEPVYDKFIDILEKVVPEGIKERFVYRYGQPKEYAKLAEERIKNLHLWADKADLAGKLVTDGVTQAESRIILRAIKEPTQMEILRTMNPDLYGRAFAARQIIDEGSQALASLKSLPDQTRDTIIENLGSYVKRVYQLPDEKRGLFRFFMGKRNIREPRIHERGKIARKIYEKPLFSELKHIKKELDFIDDISQIEGVGPIVKERLRRAGYGSIDRLSKADPYVIDDILGKKQEMNIKHAKGKTLDTTAGMVATDIPLIRKIQKRVQEYDFNWTGSLYRGGGRSRIKGATYYAIDRENAAMYGKVTKYNVDFQKLKKTKYLSLNNEKHLALIEKYAGKSLDDVEDIALLIEESLPRFKKAGFDALVIEGATGAEIYGVPIEFIIFNNKAVSKSAGRVVSQKQLLSASAWGEMPESSSWDIISQADSINRYKSKLIQRRNEINNLIAKPKIKPDIPYEVRQKMGEIETAGYPVARSIQDIGYKVETARLFEEVSSNPLFATTDKVMAQQSGWIKMPTSRQMGYLEDMYVHPAIAKDINNITRVISESDRIYQNLLSAFKMGKTTLNPATHGRNIISNMLLMEMSGVPVYRIPDLVSASIDDITKNTKLYQQFKDAGLGLGTFKSAEIEALRGVYSGRGGISGLLERAGKNLDKTFVGDLNRLYQLEEEIFKLAKARHMLEQGFTIPQALAEGEKWLFNYNKIPDFIRWIRTAPVGAPFITFQYKALPRILESLIKRPMTILKYPLLLNALEEYSQQKLGISDEQIAIIKKDRPLTFVLPFTDSNGNIRVYDMQYTVPYGELFERRDVAGFELPTFGLMQNPIYSVPYNVFIFNKDPYTGREIVNEDATNTKKAKQIFGYIAQQLLPPLTPGIGYPYKTIERAIEQRTDKYGLKYDYWWEVIGAIGGLKTKPVDIDIESYKLLKRTEALWKDYDIRQAALLKDQSLTSDERSRQFKELQEERIRGFNKLWEGVDTQKTRRERVGDDFEESPIDDFVPIQ